MRHLTDAHNAQVRLQGGERIVGDFGLGGRDARDERGLAHVGIAYQADIGEQLQLQPQDLFFSRKTLLVLTRRLVRAGGKVLIAASAASAVTPGAVGSLAVASAFAFVLRVETKVDQRIVALARFQNDVATTAAVAAGRAAARDKFLSAKGHASVTAVAAFDPDDRFVNK